MPWEGRETPHNLQRSRVKLQLVDSMINAPPYHGLLREILLHRRFCAGTAELLQLGERFFLLFVGLFLLSQMS